MDPTANFCLFYVDSDLFNFFVGVGQIFTQAIADKIEGQHRQGNGDPGKLRHVAPLEE